MTFINVALCMCAESIAFYNGEHRESAIAGSRLESLITISRLRLAWEAGLSLWQNAYTCDPLLRHRKNRVGVPNLAPDPQLLGWQSDTSDRLMAVRCTQWPLHPTVSSALLKGVMYEHGHA